MRKNILWGGLIVAIAGAAIVYASANLGWLTTQQTNFSDHQSTNHSNQLTAHVWDVLIDQLTTWAQNHESRLQVFAENPDYPNLSTEETSFLDLLSTEHSNQLTASMWDGLLSRLTMVITNHEMRIRAVEGQPDENENIAGGCYVKPEFGSKCIISNPDEYIANINKGPSGSFIQIKTKNLTSAGNIIHFGYNTNSSISYPYFYDKNFQFIDIDRVANLVPFIVNQHEYGEDYYQLYAIMTSKDYDEIPRQFNTWSSDYRQLKRYDNNHPETDGGFACTMRCGLVSCKCSNIVQGAKCEWDDETPSRQRLQKNTCSNLRDKASCERKSQCQRIDWDILYNQIYNQIL